MFHSKIQFFRFCHLFLDNEMPEVVEAIFLGRLARNETLQQIIYNIFFNLHSGILQTNLSPEILTWEQFSNAMGLALM